MAFANERMNEGGNRSLDLSIVVCTHNRARSLDRALGSISRAAQPETGRWEVLVIDNRSTDSTPAVVSAWADRLPLRYIYESEPGLSAARNRAIAEVRGRWLAFTDDDVEVDPGWLVELLNARCCWPDAGYLAGKILPRYEQTLPSWWSETCESLLAGVVVKYAPLRSSGRLNPGESRPMGANLAFDATALRAVGGFRTDLGRRGGSLIGGEEVAVLTALEQVGYHGVYVPEAVVHHYTPAERLGRIALLRYFTAVGVAAVRMGSVRPSNRLGPPRWILPKLVGTGAALIRQWLRVPGDQWIQRMRTFCFYLGAAVELLRNAPYSKEGTSELQVERSQPVLGSAWGTATGAGDQSSYSASICLANR